MRAKMDPLAFRGAIQHLHLKGLTATEIKAEFDSVHGDSAPSYGKIRYWINEFKRGRTGISDEPRSGRRKTVTDEETVRKVHEIVYDDRRVKVRDISEALKISLERVHKILHQELDMSKISAISNASNESRRLEKTVATASTPRNPVRGARIPPSYVPGTRFPPN